MRRLDDTDVLARADHARAADAITEAMAALGRGEAHQAPKQLLPGTVDGAMLLSLAAVVPTLGVAVAKWASYVPGADGRPGRSTSTILVSDPVSGELRALIEGMAATTLRTAAATAAVIRRRTDQPQIVALVGFGQVNRAVAHAIEALVPSVSELRIVTRTPLTPEQVGLDGSTHVVTTTDVAAALAGADLAISATGATGAIADLSMLPARAWVISLDGVRTWGGAAEVPTLSDHDAPVPSLAVAYADAAAHAIDAARFVDLGGCAVADAAFCAPLLEAQA